MLCPCQPVTNFKQYSFAGQISSVWIYVCLSVCVFVSLSLPWTSCCFDIECTLPINPVDVQHFVRDKVMSGLKQSRMGVLLSDVCAKTSIDINLRGPAVSVLCVCVCVFVRFAHVKLFLFLLTFLERSDSNSPKTPHWGFCLFFPSIRRLPSLSFSALHSVPSFPVSSLSLSLWCSNLSFPACIGNPTASSHLCARTHWQFHVEPHSSFFLRQNNKICFPSVCVRICAHVALRLVIYGLANIGPELKIRY